MFRKRRKRGDETVRQLAAAHEQNQALLLAAEEEIAGRDKRIAELEVEVRDLRGAMTARDTAAEGLRSRLNDAVTGLQEAVSRYRKVRLANAPDITEDLLPPCATLAETDRHFERAERVVEGVRERLASERGPNPKVPFRSAGAPRLYPDYSSLSPSEKIRLGLQRLDDAEAASH